MAKAKSNKTWLAVLITFLLTAGICVGIYFGYKALANEVIGEVTGTYQVASISDGETTTTREDYNKLTEKPEEMQTMFELLTVDFTDYNVMLMNYATEEPTTLIFATYEQNGNVITLTRVDAPIENVTTVDKMIFDGEKITWEETTTTKIEGEEPVTTTTTIVFEKVKVTE